MSEYTVIAVSDNVKEYPGKYGNMKNYKIKFEETPDVIVQLSQKAETPAPKTGDVIEGTIDMSAQYGPKFKKAFTPKAGGNTSGNNYNKPDPRTMYVSYAKDIVMALIAKGIYPHAAEQTFNSEFNAALQAIILGGDTLMNSNNTEENDEDVKAPF